MSTQPVPGDRYSWPALWILVATEAGQAGNAFDAVISRLISRATLGKLTAGAQLVVFSQGSRDPGDFWAS